VSVRVPHLAVPLRLNGPSLVEVEQDSDEDIDACVLGIMRTPLGWRTDLPEFGMPDPAHELGGPSLAEIERTVALWEDRVDVAAMRDDGTLGRMALAAGLDVVTVNAEGRS
jgi:phage baseplate assembly protein W